MTATYITQEQPLGLAHAIKQAREFTAGEPFIVYLGDNLLENGICDFVNDFRGNGADAAIMLKAVDDPRRYGVAVLDDEQRVVRLLEKPQDPPTNLAIVGVYAFQPGIFDTIEQIKPSARGELEVTDALQLLVDQGRMVKAQVIEGFWEDAGEPKSLLVANRRYLDIATSKIQCSLGDNCRIEGNVVIGKGTRVDDSTVYGPCLIGRNCVIERATIGPYAAIGDGCVISDSHIEDSVIQDHCQIAQLPAGLKGSVLGEKVHVVGGAPMTAPLTMILGDMAQIRML
jgi:glucose-1-phosphate thymidylyltransferase